ncbi:c-type cytochrome biogenesis protein CcsB [Arsenicicoccus sp. oral taxon 190]|uniref:c-type cytochrome biogenesis protein CcsB n=1 Tax=Arsenicicoccus sp. oral taxon 190 TaxID=1658671 RepID=UPI000679F060|nr:c-type cytochrome biogenesis protein CcsB [Arsenicicoccus sp. oral taxon 190]AKT51010.1 cytochrome C biogenesis protein CcsB [Arsenicicoccus sp. oral taxon 190]
MLALSQYALIAGTILVWVGLAASVVNLTRRPAQREAVVPAKVAVGGGAAVLTDPGPALAGPELGRTGGRGPAWYATLVTRVALVCLTVALAASATVTGHGPFSNQHEFAVSFAWGILAAYVFFEWKYDVKALAVGVLPIAAAMVTYAVLIDAKPGPLVPALQNSLLLTAHVFTAVLGYGAAAVACAAGIFYLLSPHLRWKGMPKRSFLDEMGYRAVMIAYPLLTVMIILGAIWADVAWGHYWSWDPKETAALVTWLIYGAYLHARVARGWRGDRAAWLLILGFVAILFTFFGNYFFGGMHSYGGSM